MPQDQLRMVRHALMLQVAIARKSLRCIERPFRFYMLESLQDSFFLRVFSSAPRNFHCQCCGTIRLRDGRGIACCNLKDARMQREMLVVAGRACKAFDGRPVFFFCVVVSVRLIWLLWRATSGICRVLVAPALQNSLMRACKRSAGAIAVCGRLRCIEWLV